MGQIPYLNHGKSHRVGALCCDFMSEIIALSKKRMHRGRDRLVNWAIAYGKVPRRLKPVPVIFKNREGTPVGSTHANLCNSDL